MWCSQRFRLNGQKMKNKFWIVILGLGLGGCQQAIFRDQKSVDADLEAYRQAKDLTSVSDVQACWKKDSLLVELIDSVLVRSNDIKIGFLQMAISRSEFAYQRGLRKPTVAGVIQPSLRRFGKYTMDGVGNFDTQFSTNITKEQIIPENLPDLQMGVQSSWEWDIWGKLAKEKRLARYVIWLLSQVSNG